MIDCSGLDMTKGTTKQTITGLYDKVKKAIYANKPIFCYNAVLGDSTNKLSPFTCFAHKTSTENLIVTSSTLQIIITKDDDVTIENLVSNRG